MSKIAVVVSVDWEGRSLLPENLERIAGFRRRHPEIPLQHFLNPAYYTRRKADAAATTRAIRRVVMPEDEQGLHVHAWRSLLLAAGVEPRAGPRFLDGNPSVPKAADDWGFYPAEDGYDVPLEEFAADELERLIDASATILQEQGFRRPVSFRAGGWMSGRKVQSALSRAGFALDASAVDPQLTVRRFGDVPLSRWLAGLWPAIDTMSQPYRIATGCADLWEFPNNAGLVDYTATDALMEIFLRNVSQWRANPERHRFVSTGFHQETARKFLDRLEEAIALMKRVAAENDLPLTFTASPLEFLP